MADELDEITEVEEEREVIDYVSLGKAMKKIRSAAGLRQEDAAKIFNVSRTVYTKYETGTAKPKSDGLEAFAKRFNVSLDELMKKVSVAIPDTCALLKNKRLLHMLLEDYDQVMIPTTVMRELSFRKTQKETPQERKTAKVAWQVMASIVLEKYWLKGFWDIEYPCHSDIFYESAARLCMFFVYIIKENNRERMLSKFFHQTFLKD